MQLALGMGTDDVRAECRARVAEALHQFRSTRRPEDQQEEKRYTRAAVRNLVRDFARRAQAGTRRPLADKSWGTIVADESATFVTGVAPDAEDIVIARERQHLMERSVSLLRARMGRAKFQEIQDWIENQGSRSNADECRARRGRAQARRILAAPTFKALEGSLHRIAPMPFSPEQLENTDHLARVALVHGRQPDSFDRDHLLSLVNEINDGVGFPTCFARGKDDSNGSEYDPADADCAEHCGFRRECAACLGGPYRDAKIEAGLMQLKGAPHHSQQEPTGHAHQTELGADVPVPSLPSLPERASEPDVLPPDPSTKRAANVEHVAAEDATDVVDVAAEVIQTAPAVTTKAAKAPPKKAPPKKAPPKRVKSRPRSPEKAAATRPHTYAPLSGRMGVVPPNQLAIKGEHFRLPQGSAVVAAMLPLGTKVKRVWPVRGDEKRYFYVLEKIADGEMGQRTDGKKRKRDGTWKVVQVFNGQHVEKAGHVWQIKDGAVPLKRHTLLNVEGTLSGIAHKITSSKSWSGARFFGLTVEAVAEQHPNLKKSIAAQPTSMYDYR